MRLPVIFRLLCPGRGRIIRLQPLEPCFALIPCHIGCVTAIVTARRKTLHRAVKRIGFVVRARFRVGDDRLITVEPGKSLAREQAWSPTQLISRRCQRNGWPIWRRKRGWIWRVRSRGRRNNAWSAYWLSHFQRNQRSHANSESPAEAGTTYSLSPVFFVGLFQKYFCRWLFHLARKKTLSNSTRRCVAAPRVARRMESH